MTVPSRTTVRLLGVLSVLELASLAVLLVNLSGRGDKDVQSVEQTLAEAADVPHR